MGNNGICMTQQRRVILEELRSLTSHPTADDIYQMVRKRVPHISLGTVYRNLEILSDCGLIQTLHTSGTQKRFDGNPENHCHVRCQNCGRVDDTSVEPLVDLADAVAEITGYDIIGYRLEFIGLCASCRKALNDSGLANHNVKSAGLEIR